MIVYRILLILPKNETSINTYLKTHSETFIDIIEPASTGVFEQ